MRLLRRLPQRLPGNPDGVFASLKRGGAIIFLFKRDTTSRMALEQPDVRPSLADQVPAFDPHKLAAAATQHDSPPTALIESS